MASGVAEVGDLRSQMIDLGQEIADLGALIAEIDILGCNPFSGDRPKAFHFLAKVKQHCRLDHRADLLHGGPTFVGQRRDQPLPTLPVPLLEEALDFLVEALRIDPHCHPQLGAHRLLDSIPGRSVAGLLDQFDASEHLDFGVFRGAAGLFLGHGFSFGSFAKSLRKWVCESGGHGRYEEDRFDLHDRKKFLTGSREFRREIWPQALSHFEWRAKIVEDDRRHSFAPGRSPQQERRDLPAVGCRDAPAERNQIRCGATPPETLGAGFGLEIPRQVGLKPKGR